MNTWGWDDSILGKSLCLTVVKKHMINTVQKLTLASVKDGCIKIYVLETERHAYDGFWFGFTNVKTRGDDS
jgi:hypothetical protein